MNSKLICLLISSFILLSGCESGDSDNSAYQESAIVKTKNHTPDGLTFGTDSFEVVVGSSTKVLKQRPSCSGFNVASASDIQIGDTIEFNVIDSMTTYYPGKPKTTPSSITAFRPECLAKDNVIVVDCSSPCNNQCGGSCSSSGNR